MNLVLTALVIVSLAFAFIFWRLYRYPALDRLPGEREIDRSIVTTYIDANYSQGFLFLTSQRLVWYRGALDAWSRRFYGTGLPARVLPIGLKEIATAIAGQRQWTKLGVAPLELTLRDGQKLQLFMAGAWWSRRKPQAWAAKINEAVERERLLAPLEQEPGSGSTSAELALQAAGLPLALPRWLLLLTVPISVIAVISSGESGRLVETVFVLAPIPLGVIWALTQRRRR